MRNARVDVSLIEKLSQENKVLLRKVENMRAELNRIANGVKTADKQEERNSLIKQGQKMKEELSALESTLMDSERTLRTELFKIPNLTHPDAPVGESDADNVEMKRVGEVKKFDFVPKDHLALGKELGVIDFEAGAKTTGNKFYFLKNDGVLLEFALVQYALEILSNEGFVLHTTPDLARLEVIEKVGFIPRGPETQIYRVADEELGLIATAEITLGGMHKDELLPWKTLPLKVAGVSHCFRTEAGTYGRASKGLYRVHQFTKVEMFIFSAPSDSDAMLERIVKIEEKIFQGLEIPYRLVGCCTADLGGPAYRKFDIEAWMPADAKWGEITSASNCTDYQSRRLNIRAKSPAGQKPELVHTLNGTAIAISRAIIAILENFQEKDGSVRIPTPLQRWIGKDKISPLSRRTPS